MFRSQVIKCYELPYCTLEILAPNQFRLIIESLDQAYEPTFELSSDRAALIPLAQTLQKHWQSVTPPTTNQQERQPFYPVPFIVDDQSYAPQLSWGQLSDLVKILDAYQTDLQHHPTFPRHLQKYRVSLIVLIVLGIMGGVIARLKLDRQSFQTALPPSQSSPEQTTPTSPLSQTTPSLSASQGVSQKQLKLSESLEQLEQLSPPPAVTTPSTPLSGDIPNLPPPQPLPEPTVTPPKPPLPTVTFPEANHPRKQVKSIPKPQPETLFDQTPQVAEIRNYFQSRWEPPANLEQDLEYQMVISGNGALEEIIPLGRAAEKHLSTLPLPQLHQRFVSASPTKANQKIRLVFRPNGQINTFFISGKP
ncbi:MAG: hypothetical protein GVY17_07445 [Cyanobacteria bacterium]|jgi:hypothetical protein|nr:hypothetical protein [Cyanobacteria bacterium GSL.Bin21]